MRPSTYIIYISILSPPCNILGTVISISLTFSHFNNIAEYCNILIAIYYIANNYCHVMYISILQYSTLTIFVLTTNNEIHRFIPNREFREFFIPDAIAVSNDTHV